MSALDVIEQLESLSPAELQHEINEQRDRLQLMERLMAILTGGSPRGVCGKYKPRRQPSDGAASADGTPSAVATEYDPVELRRRIASILQVQGPQSWTQLMSQAETSPTRLKLALDGSGFQKINGLYSVIQ